MRIRPVTPDDHEPIAAILAHEVIHGVAHFGLTPPTPESVAADFAQVDPARHPAFVAEDASGVLGFCKSAPWQTREAYAWSVEITVYVRADARGRGVGKALYATLIPRLRELGYRNAIGGITQPNPASVALHESFGMTRVALYPAIGYKHAAWHDVGYWRLDLNPHLDAIDPPAPG